jgi:methyl-accepting chemotaxis protein PixJ
MHPEQSPDLDRLSYPESPLVINHTQLNQTTPKPTNRIQSFLQRHLIATILISASLNLGLTGTSTWGVWQTSHDLELMVAKQAKLQNLRSKIEYLDEVLTMSANMWTNTGQQIWEKRYNDTVPLYEKTLAELTKDIPSPKLDEYTKILLADEDRAFKLTREGKVKEASQLLIRPEYLQTKQIYTQELDRIVDRIQTSVDSLVSKNRESLSGSISLALLSLGLFVVTSALVSLVVRSYILDREKAQKSLQVFQNELLKLNQELTEEAKLRTAQQEKIVAETATLQADIGHILDVVCSIESGDLTIQAKVNERSTGLISDTLNRSIESLHRIITVVVSSADGVTNSAESLEQLAVETATQAQTQTRSIREIENSIAQIDRLTANSLNLALASTDAMQLAQAAVSNGQQEMTEMADGIASLEQGTEQVVRRVQLLNEFVELAAQFSKEQKRVGALTRVLALNASLLSTRAVKEQDPEQFASLANEFEAIADRVNDLAIETNTSLVSLEHRTSQIQTVASGLDRDIADIRQLVQKFTGEMSKSRQAFTNIQMVTDRVAGMGQEVNTSSEDIVRVVSETLIAVRSIGVITQTTEDRAIITREQVQKMGNLARNLLQMVEFFQLEQTPTTAHPRPLPEDSSAVKNPDAIYHLLRG